MIDLVIILIVLLLVSFAAY
ncbi:type I toxin-antitoxin system Ibs family toxin [Escherichia coli]